MSDTTTTTETGNPPIALLANSYDLHALEAATRHAEGLKTEDGRDAALARIPEGLALNQEVIAAQNAPAVPEGSELAEVEDANGRIVQAAVSTAVEDAAPTATDDGKTSRRRTTTPPDSEGAGA